MVLLGTAASALYGISSLLQPQYATSTPTVKEADPVDLSAVDPKSIRRAKGITEEEIKIACNILLQAMDKIYAL